MYTLAFEYGGVRHTYKCNSFAEYKANREMLLLHTKYKMVLV